MCHTRIALLSWHLRSHVPCHGVAVRRRKRTKTAAEQPEAPPTPAPATPAADTAAGAHGPADAQADGRAGQGIGAQQMHAQQQLEQELAEAREALQNQMNFIDAFTERENELTTREDAVLVREEAVAASENAVRVREEAVAVQSAHLAAKDTSLVERATELTMREAALNVREHQHASKQAEQAEQEELQHVQETVESLVEQVADSVGNMERPQTVVPEAAQTDVACAAPRNAEEIMPGVEAAKERECGDDALCNSLGAVGLDENIATIATIATIASGAVQAADNVSEVQDLPTVVLSAETTQAVGDTSETQDLPHVEPPSESGEQSRTHEDASDEDTGDAIHSSEAVTTECAEQNLEQLDTTDTPDDNTAESQTEQIEDADVVEMSSPTPSISANADDLVEESNDLEPSRDDKTENAETPGLYSEAEPRVELEQESVPLVDAQLDASEDNVQSEDDSAANTLFTLDEFEAEMNRQRDLDEAQERHDDAHGNHGAAADTDEPR